MNNISDTKVRQLFELALVTCAHERAGFVQRMCGEGTEPCPRVMEFVEADDEVGDFLAQPTAPASPRPFTPAPGEVGETPGTVIGNYKPLHDGEPVPNRNCPGTQDPKRALELAQRACEETERVKRGDVWRMLRTLARAVPGGRPGRGHGDPGSCDRTGAPGTTARAREAAPGAREVG